MASLQELLEQDMGLAETVKTASANDTDELDRLAASLGLGFEKEAEEEDEEEEEEEKKASVEMGGIYSRLFPEDEVLYKTAAEQEKIAAEQNLGARAFDYYADRFDRRIEKLASDVLTGGATISAATSADPVGNVHKDPSIPQATKNNRPANASQKIDTTPVVNDDVTAKNDERTVGHFEQQKAAAIMDAALRKQYLLSQLED